MVAGEIVSAEVPLLAQLYWKSTSFLRNELEPWSLRMGLTIYELLGTAINISTCPRSAANKMIYKLSTSWNGF